MCCLKKLVCVLVLLISAGWQMDEMHRYVFEHHQMGTTFRLICYAPNPGLAALAAKAAFSKIDQYNGIFSDYDASSDLNLLQASCTLGNWYPVRQELCEVITYAREVADYSDGAFDIGVGSLTRIWRKAIRRQEVPDSGDIRLASTAASESWEFDPANCQIRFLKTKSRIDLGGIAKGYALDAAAGILRHYGIHTYLLDGGGDILTGKSPPGKEGWEIALPGGGNLILNQGAVATSGDTYRYLSGAGYRYSHIIDPALGYGLNHQKTVTVRASTGMMADAWATAVSVLLQRGPLDVELRVYLDNHDIDVLFPESGN